MAQYIKNGVIYSNLTSIKLNGKQIINPKEAQILAAGYEVYDYTTGYLDQLNFGTYIEEE